MFIDIDVDVEYCYKNDMKNYKYRFQSHVKRIEYDDYFNSSIGPLHNDITYIKFGFEFNRSIKNLQNLHSLKSIIFGAMFNRSIDNLPQSITSIEFSCRFDRSLKPLPKFVRTLCFDHVHCEYIYNGVNIHITKFIHHGFYMSKQRNNCLNHQFSLKQLNMKSSKPAKIPYGCVYINE